MQVCGSYAGRSRNALLLLLNHEFCRVLSSWVSGNTLICAEISLCFRICPTTMQKVSDSSDEPEAQKKADEVMRKDWKVENGLLTYVGTGYDNICTESQYKDFEMYVDWALDPNGKEPDAGIYLRGTPQVQIWDTARVNVGAQVGSGGLYNNKKYESKPSVVADNKVGIWNSFYIKMVGDKVTVFLNGVKVVDAVTMENYWDRKQPIFPVEQIELQAHGSKVYYRDLYIKRLE